MRNADGRLRALERNRPAPTPAPVYLVLMAVARVEALNCLSFRAIARVASVAVPPPDPETAILVLRGDTGHHRACLQPLGQRLQHAAEARLIDPWGKAQMQ
jgi:hypothetical protein